MLNRSLCLAKCKEFLPQETLIVTWSVLSESLITDFDQLSDEIIVSKIRVMCVIFEVSKEGNDQFSCLLSYIELEQLLSVLKKIKSKKDYLLEDVEFDNDLNILISISENLVCEFVMQIKRLREVLKLRITKKNFASLIVGLIALFISISYKHRIVIGDYS